MKQEKVVLCGANAYEEKYYFNEKFSGIPKSIQDELRVISILFTQEVGGIFTIAFEEDGTLVLETASDEEDITLDNFTSIVDDQSWIEFMPQGVTKDKFSAFKKYYDPDIFRAAGKKIRGMTMAADNASIEERIGRIATITYI